MKKLTLNNEIKYRVVDRYTRESLRKSVVNKEREIHLKESSNKIKEELRGLISKYVVDPELKELWDKYPRIFKSTDLVEVSGKLLGLFDSDWYTGPDDGYEKIRVSTTIQLSGVKVPAEATSWKTTYTLTKEDIEKFPKKELDAIKDELYELILGEYECQKSIYDPTEPSRLIIRDGTTYQKLFNFSQELYEEAVIRNFGATYLIYEDDGVEIVDKKKQREVSKMANMDKNEIALEELKKLINL